MAHEIAENDSFGEVRAFGKRAWHGLGNEIPPELTAAEAFRHQGMDWETELCPVYCKTGDDLEVTVPIEGHFAHVCKQDRTFLGIVTSAYKPFENMDLAKLADALVAEGVKTSVETCGTLYARKRVYVLVKMPKVIRVARGDEVETFILVSNGHGGFASLCAYPTSIRVVCANTLRWSEASLKLGGVWRHTGDLEGKIRQARLVLGLAQEETVRFEAMVKRLAAKHFDQDALDRYMDRAYDECFGKVDLEGDAATVEKLVEKKQLVLIEWKKNIEDDRNTMAGVRGTAWAAYNAVSQWHDHQRGRFATVAESDARVHSNLFGASQDSKLRAFRTALEV
jgi:phage/plasmid-like protein (TIGR03299 family)